MKFTELTVLLPCHSLEDFPAYHQGTSADELLAAWTALWHPALIAAAQAVPQWHRADTSPETLSGRLLTVPPFCLDRLPAGFAARAKNEGAWLVEQSTLDSAVAAALAGLHEGEATPAPSIDGALERDFLALGFARLQLELLTRQMRYSMNIDETHFRNELVAAAQAALAGDESSARAHLAQCFDTLYESRKHFYPVDVYLLDMTLLAESTPDEALVRELASGSPTNLVTTARALHRVAESSPSAREALLKAIDQGLACVAGGELDELELPLLPAETALASFAAGAREFAAILGRRPTVYARRRAGLGPLVPQLLVKFAYHGAVHVTLDDGRFPLGSQGKTRWEGLDGSVLDVFARLPSDAARTESYLSLPRKLADSMDNDHVATAAFAHWPAASSPWHGLLRRVAQLSEVLGKFVPLDEYFSSTDMPGRLSRFEADEYRTPYLKQAVATRQSDPISRFVRAHRWQAARAARQTVATLRGLISQQASLSEPAEPPQPDALVSEERLAVEREALEAELRGLAACLPRSSAPPVEGFLAINPLSFARRMTIELPGPERQVAAVDVPALGFAGLADSAVSSVPRGKPLAHDNVLKNEFFEVTISRSTGGIQSLYNFQQRGNQLSQQLALRVPAPEPTDGSWHDPDSGAQYTTMRAESVEVTAATAALGEIVSRGALVAADGTRVAGYRQTVQVAAKSRVIRLTIEIDLLGELTADPWNAYLAARFAWPAESAELSRGVGLCRQPTEAARLESPDYIDVDNGSATISLLTGGLPYHRRSAPRMLDSLLIVAGERARSFEMAIGVDLPQPAAAALELITPPTVLRETAPPLASSGWLFHLDAKNVVATHWEPLLDEAGETASPAVPRGFRARLLETAGRPGRVTLRAFRPLAAARQVDFLGQTMLEVPAENDKITLDFSAHEWIEVEAVWAS